MSAPEAQAEVLAPLPPPPRNLAGDSKADGRGYSVKVSTKTGYLASIELDAVWQGVQPADVFAVFANPGEGEELMGCRPLGLGSVRSVGTLLMPAHFGTACMWAGKTNVQA